MTFTVTPGVLLGLLNQVCKDVPRRRREGLQLTLSAGRGRVSIIGNGMNAAVSTPVRGQGQCRLKWGIITEVLATFSASKPVRVECNRNNLTFDSFSMAVDDFKPEAVPKEQAPPSVPSPELPLPSEPVGVPACASAPDGYSLLPPGPDDDDRTGTSGMVSPEDSKGIRAPVVCPACQSVGYFKKREYSGGHLLQSPAILGYRGGCPCCGDS